MSDIIRRDPRKEWIARNRLHPEHLDVLAELGEGTAPSEWPGPNGRVRRNPHAVGFTGPNGIKRIDRSGVQQGAGRASAGGRADGQPARQRVEIESPAFLVAVVPDLAGGRLSSHDRDLLGLARRLADADPQAPGAVVAIVFGEARESGFDEAGVDRLITLDEPRLAGYAPEARIAALSAIEESLSPRHWLLPDSSLGGGELGRRLAARLGERPATGLWQIEPDAGSALGWHATSRGAAGSLDIRRDLPRVALALAECAEPVSETVHAARPLAVPPLPEAFSRVEDLGAVAVDPASVALGEAEFILAAGNGIRDWDGYHRAATALGATEGASRVAVDDGFMPRDRQVGATGTWVTARVYVAVGISGAIQHLQGIQRCDKVVAVNVDPGCDMIKRADLAVIGDAGEILASLVARVERERQAAEEQRDVA
ncbi:electron transfer flavoprotein subunit alpha/FixB family protein [Modicisalibacter tunisiensis]|uniref:electron transfer flavoprotein subunit alpha n=1 Tax=Modicisalibacter tunisiensis TaxID=390637 RepID=UPI001CCAA947|nr:electron transfer flavoprotein subunit alpha/FixB family protein [Modicisalibacter tunisiensis]MBZ9540323.1 electron transfer flavoprotein subunit alpha/FixB family protein [Modicisalibacter tunisiensis]